MAERNFDRRAKTWRDRQAIWLFNLHHWEGGRTLYEHTVGGTRVGLFNRSGYLKRQTVEGDDSFDSRLERSPGLYDNLPKRAIMVYSSQVYRERVHRKLPPVIEEMAEDVDLLGTDAQSFWEAAFEAKERDGLAAVLVDAPSVADGTSEGERRAARMRPYMELVEGAQIIDYGIEISDPATRGQVLYVVIRDEYDRSNGAFQEPDEIVRHRVWTRDEWEVWEGAGSSQPEMIDSGVNAIGVVPIVLLYGKRLAPFVGTTVIDDVALSANALWNAASIRDEAFVLQGFSLLVIQSDDKTLQSLKVGRARALRVAVGEDARYIAPENGPYDAYDRFAREIVERVADMVFCRTNRQLPTGQVESAEKREVDRTEFLATLKRKSAEMQAAELVAWAIAHSYFSNEESEIEVEYDQNFKVTERMPDDWIKATLKGVQSREEWYMANHPGVEEDDATLAITQNLERERKWTSLEPMPSMPDAADFDFSTDDVESTDQAEADGQAEERPPGQAGQGTALPPRDVLNGAQVASMVGVVKDAAAGTISRESAIETLVLAFGLSRTEAIKLLGPEIEPPEEPDEDEDEEEEESGGGERFQPRRIPA